MRSVNVSVYSKLRGHPSVLARFYKAYEEAQALFEQRFLLNKRQTISPDDLKSLLFQSKRLCSQLATNNIKLESVIDDIAQIDLLKLIIALRKLGRPFSQEDLKQEVDSILSEEDNIYYTAQKLIFSNEIIYRTHDENTQQTPKQESAYVRHGYGTF